MAFILSEREWDDVTDVIHKGDVEALKDLIAKNPRLKDEYGTNGYGIIHYACLKENVDDALEYLASPDSGVDVDMRTLVNGSFGETPLMVAAVQGDPEKIEILLKNPQTDVNVRTKMGSTAIVLATWSAGVENVKAILDNSDSVDFHLDDNDATKNPIACAKKQIELYSELEGEEEGIKNWKEILELLEKYHTKEEDADTDLANKVAELEVSEDNGS
jgi:ankyrin repeat protein